MLDSAMFFQMGLAPNLMALEFRVLRHYIP